MKRISFAFLLIGLLVFALGACGEHTDAAVEPTTTGTSTNENQYIAYYISDILFEVPSTWAPNDVNGDGLSMYFYPESSSEDVFLMVSFTETSDSIMRSGALDEVISGIEETAIGYELTDKAVKENLSGLSYAQVEYTQSINDITYRTLNSIYDCESGIAVIALCQPFDAAVDYSEEYYSIVNLVANSNSRPVEGQGMIGLAKDLSTANSAQTSESSTPISEKDQVEATLRGIVAEYYDDTDVSAVTINENLGTDETDDYVALVYLTWNVKNSKGTTKEMLAMYSEDFAARVGMELEHVTDFAVFWTVPYYSASDTIAKYSYERKGGGMYQTDAMIGSALQ